MTDASSTRSGHCAREVHVKCPHFASGAGRGSLWRPRPSSAWTFIAEARYAHAGFREVTEVVFALPFDFAPEDDEQILTDTATRLGPALGWRPGG